MLKSSHLLRSICQNAPTVLFLTSYGQSSLRWEAFHASYSACPFTKSELKPAMLGSMRTRDNVVSFTEGRGWLPSCLCWFSFSLVSSMRRWWPQLWCKAHSFPEHLWAQVDFCLGQLRFPCVSMKCSFLGNIWKVNCTSHSQSLFEFFLVLLSLSCNRSDVKEETCLSKIYLSGNTYSVALSPWSLCFIPFESIHCLSFWGFVFVFCFFGGVFLWSFFPWRQRNKSSSFLLQCWA